MKRILTILPLLFALVTGPLFAANLAVNAEPCACELNGVVCKCKVSCDMGTCCCIKKENHDPLKKPQTPNKDDCKCSFNPSDDYTPNDELTLPKNSTQFFAITGCNFLPLAAQGTCFTKVCSTGPPGNALPLYLIHQQFLL